MTKNPIKNYILFLFVFTLLALILPSFNPKNLSAKQLWISKINGKTITLQDFNSAYQSVGLFGTLTSPVPISEKQVKQLLNNKKRKKEFLKVYEDEFLILNEAKKKKVFQEKDIDQKVKMLSEMIKRQLIIKQFILKNIYPKIKVSSKEINQFYRREMNKKQSQIKQIPQNKAKKIIQERLKIEKLNSYLKKFIDNLRLESSIVHNEKVIN